MPPQKDGVLIGKAVAARPENRNDIGLASESAVCFDAREKLGVKSLPLTYIVSVIVEIYGATATDFLSSCLLPRHLPGQRSTSDLSRRRDRTLFLEKLRVSIEIYDVRLHAYVLMGNHFHFKSKIKI